jgi:hypothetical protein
MLIGFSLLVSLSSFAVERLHSISINPLTLERRGR